MIIQKEYKYISFEIGLWFDHLYWRWLGAITTFFGHLISIISLGYLRCYIGLDYFGSRIHNFKEPFEVNFWRNSDGMIWMFLWRLSEMPSLMIEILTFGVFHFHLDVLPNIFMLSARAIASDITN